MEIAFLLRKDHCYPSNVCYSVWIVLRWRCSQVQGKTEQCTSACEPKEPHSTAILVRLSCHSASNFFTSCSNSQASLLLHLLTFLLFIFLHSYSSFKCKQTAKISMCKKKEGMFTPLRLNNLDVLPQETLWVSFTLTCCNWLFTLWWAKGFSLKIPFCKQLWVFQYFIKIFLGNYIQNNYA